MASSTTPLQALVELVAVLRGPDGCPWDRDQGIDDIRGYLLEEAHETAAAIDSEDWSEIRAELGDLLFQIVFVAQIASEKGQFAIEDVVAGIIDKMTARHPHVFGTESLDSAAAVHRAWERRKAEQRSEEESALAGVPASLPALLAAYRMAQKAAGVGFDWIRASEVLDKIEEEIAELRAALSESAGESAADDVREEIGDLLFTVANLARKLDHDPEAALAAANRKFRRRFARMEADLAHRQRSLGAASADEMEASWQRVKIEEDRAARISDEEPAGAKKAGADEAGAHKTGTDKAPRAD